MRSSIPRFPNNFVVSNQQLCNRGVHKKYACFSIQKSLDCSTQSVCDMFYVNLTSSTNHQDNNVHCKSFCAHLPQCCILQISLIKSLHEEILCKASLSSTLSPEEPKYMIVQGHSHSYSSPQNLTNDHPEANDQLPLFSCCYVHHLVCLQLSNSCTS